MKKSLVLVLGLFSLLLGSCSGSKENLPSYDDTLYEFNNFIYTDSLDVITIKEYNGNDKIVNIPATINGKKVYGIADNAFNSIEDVEEVIIPEGITSVDRAFHNMPDLKKVYLPSSLKITSLLVNECHSFDGFIINNLVDYLNINMSSSLCNKPFNIYLEQKLIEDFVVPFESKELKNNCFKNCKSIKSLKLHNDVKRIADAFENTPNFTTIYVDSLTEYTKIIFDYPLINNRDFYVKNQLIEDLVLPEGIDTISESAFSGAKFKSITFPKRLEVIAKYSFSECVNLTKLIFPDGIKVIDNYAFSNCTNLSDIEFADTITNINDRAFYNTAIINIRLPKNLESLGFGAFDGNEYLTTVKFNEKLEIISERAFADCVKLDNVVLPENIIALSDYSFSGCSNLKNIILSSNINTLPFAVFEKTGFVEFNVPNTIKYIKSFAISSKNLNSIYVPKEVIEVDYSAICGNGNTIAYFGRHKEYDGYNKEMLNNIKTTIYDYNK